MRWRRFATVLLGSLLVVVVLTWWLARRPVEVPPLPQEASAPGLSAAEANARGTSPRTERPTATRAVTTPAGTTTATPLPGATLAPTPTAAQPTQPSTTPTSDVGDQPEARATDEEGDAGVRFTMDRDGIRAAMTSARPGISECYEAWLAATPDLAGGIAVSFRIAPNPDGGAGFIDEVHIVDGGLGHVAMEGCALNALQDVTFDVAADAEPLRVTYPFVFAPKEKEGD